MSPKKRLVNQKLIYINKKNSHTYFSLDAQKAFTAMRRLTTAGFAMYLFLCQTKSGKVVYSSCKEFRTKTGFSTQAYVNGKKDLIKNNYLIPREDGDFDFYNYPLILPTRKDGLMDEILNKIDEENKNKIF